MTKEQLTQYITELGLDAKIEDLLVELVEKAPEVNPELLNFISQVLEMQANFYDKTADALEQVGESYEKLAANLTMLDEEENAQKIEAANEVQEKLVADINKKVEEFKLKAGTQQADTKKIEEIKQTLETPPEPPPGPPPPPPPQQ